jgi:hypothetical protein
VKSDGAPTLVPPTVDVGDESIAVRLAPDEAGGWIATVLILRRADSGSRVQGEDVEAHLTDGDGRELSIVERPTGALVEAGDTLGVSANARFRFAETGARPAALSVSYRGLDAPFEIRWEEDER